MCGEIETSQGHQKSNRSQQSFHTKKIEIGNQVQIRIRENL